MATGLMVITDICFFYQEGIGTIGQIIPIMTPEDAWNVDMKMDDGMPGQGKVVSIRRDADNFFDCTTMPDGSNPAADEIEATYRLSNTDDACALIFRNVL